MQHTGIDYLNSTTNPQVNMRTKENKRKFVPVPIVDLHGAIMACLHRKKDIQGSSLGLSKIVSSQIHDIKNTITIIIIISSIIS